VNGFLVLGIASGLLVQYTSANGFMLGLEKLRFLEPVFEGDTIYAECTVLEARESKSYPESGIVKISTVGYNQRREKIIEFDRTFMVRKKGRVWRGKI
jgi:itaconyl-CoA hydratase